MDITCPEKLEETVLQNFHFAIESIVAMKNKIYIGIRMLDESLSLILYNPTFHMTYQ